MPTTIFGNARASAAATGKADRRAPATSSIVLHVSLTSILREHAVPLYPIEVAFLAHGSWSAQKTAIVVPPPTSYRKGLDFALAGVAFDFFLRALLCVHNMTPEPGTILDELAEFLAERHRAGLPTTFPTVIDPIAGSETLNDALAIVNERRASGIVTGDILSDAFLQNCIDAARLEGLLRTGNIRPPQTPDTLADLRRLAKLAWKQRSLLSCERLALNPSFPRFSEILHGCDADAALDDLLIEIKTTKDAIPIGAATQAVAYAYLDAIEQRLDGKSPRWYRVGVYAARYGNLCVAPVHAFAQFFPLLKNALGILS